MSDRTFAEQLTKYLTDVHSIEEQALAETEDQERLVREQLERRGAKPSAAKDVAGRVGGWGMVLFAWLNPDTPGKLAMHAYSYEHMELAAYELLRRIAERAQDTAVAQMAARIGEQERAMADR